MNAWPEAVWIVRKMKKFFNLDTRVLKCESTVDQLNTNIATAIDTVNDFRDELQGLDNIIQLQQTLEQIENKIQRNLEDLQRIKDQINNISKTPAIFDQDISPADEKPDSHSEEFTDNSVWFIES